MRNFDGSRESSLCQVSSNSSSRISHMRSLLPVCTLLLVYACGSPQPKETQAASAIIGTWTMEQVLRDGADVTREHNPADNRWIRFDSKGTFTSDGDPMGRNTGRWSLADSSSELYLDSDAGENDDSYWIVSFASDTMRWAGARFDFNKRFELVHLRSTINQ